MQVMVAVGTDLVVVDADSALAQPLGRPTSLIAIAPGGQYVACCSPDGHQTVRTLDLTQVIGADLKSNKLASTLDTGFKA